MNVETEIKRLKRLREISNFIYGGKALTFSLIFCWFIAIGTAFLVGSVWSFLSIILLSWLPILGMTFFLEIYLGPDQTSWFSFKEALKSSFLSHVVLPPYLLLYTLFNPKGKHSLFQPEFLK